MPSPKEIAASLSKIQRGSAPIAENAMPEGLRPARFRDYDSDQRGTLCLLFTDGGEGEYIGHVYLSVQGWVWEADRFDDEEDDCREGVEDTRRAAKASLRRYLRSVGILPKHGRAVAAELESTDA